VHSRRLVESSSSLWIAGISSGPPKSFTEAAQNTHAGQGHVGSRMLQRLERYIQAGVFDCDEVRILTTAFDQSWRAVQDSGASFGSNGEAEATREILALRIIEMARLGERDHRRLCDDALLYLARTKSGVRK
jgi:hypothetical protein